METKERYKKMATAFDVEKLLPGRVLLKRLPPEDMSAEGAALPENRAEKNLHCRVLGIGNPRTQDIYGNPFPDGNTEPTICSDPPIKVGDLVSVRQYTGQRINRVDSTEIIVDGKDIEGGIIEGVFIPAWNWVLVAADARQEAIGHIQLPELSQGEPASGHVVASGPGYYTKKGVFINTRDDLPIGSRVLFNRWAGYRPQIKGREYSLVTYFKDFEWRTRGGKEGICRNTQMSSCKTDIYAIIPSDVTVSSIPQVRQLI